MRPFQKVGNITYISYHSRYVNNHCHYTLYFQALSVSLCINEFAIFLQLVIAFENFMILLKSIERSENMWIPYHFKHSI